MADVACIHAAGCDLAIADAGFRLTAARASGNGMVASLRKMHKHAKRAYHKCPGAGGLLTLMDVQLCRIVTACYPVRDLCPLAHWIALGMQRHSALM